MSWLSDLAGKAENILNKIDQNAANVLKSETDQLIEVKCNGDNVKMGISTIKRTTSSHSLRLLRTPKKNVNKSEEVDTRNKDEKIAINITNNNDDSVKAPGSVSNASNSSRRSSWSSRTEAITVIEYPIAPLAVTAPITDMNSSVHSVQSIQSTEDERNELAAVKIVLAQMKSERDQLKSELDELNQQVAMDHTNELVADLERTCNELTTEKEQLSDRLEEISLANAAYLKSISELETTVSKLHQSEIDLAEKLNWAKSEREQAIQELQQYRSRAQHTLQLKDQLIEELKGSTVSVPNSNADLSPYRDHSEIHVLQSERESLLAELQTLRNQIEVGKQYSKSLEGRISDIEHRSKEREEFLNNSLQRERRNCIQFEDNLQVRLKELNAAREEMTRQQTNSSLKNHESETELTKLKAKIAQLNYAGSSSKGFDERINSLTQSLVQKQNSLEAVTVERNAIRIQFEKLEHQHHMTLTMVRQQQPSRIINVNDTDDDKSQVPNFMQENPFDTRVARRIKRAYSSLDSTGIRLGVFLRRYPLVRVFVIVYVAILHLWVMIVLLSSTPN